MRNCDLTVQDAMILLNLIHPWTIHPLKQSGIKLTIKLNKRCGEAAKCKVIIFFLANVPQSSQTKIMIYQGILQEYRVSPLTLTSYMTLVSYLPCLSLKSGGPKVSSSSKILWYRMCFFITLMSPLDFQQGLNVQNNSSLYYNLKRQTKFVTIKPKQRRPKKKKKFSVLYLPLSGKCILEELDNWSQNSNSSLFLMYQVKQQENYF